MWSRANGAFYEREICVLEVDEDGPVGDPTCYFGDEGQGLDEEDEFPSCNADGTKIAWARGTGYGGAHDIWVMDCEDLTDCDTANAENLTDDFPYDRDDIHPSWSPSGTQLCFTRDRDGGGNYDIWVMNSDGSGVNNLTYGSSDDNPDCAWGPARL